jgi:hypothetical protein
MVKKVLYILVQTDAFIFFFIYIPILFLIIK